MHYLLKEAFLFVYAGLAKLHFIDLHGDICPLHQSQPQCSGAVGSHSAVHTD